MKSCDSVHCERAKALDWIGNRQKPLLPAGAKLVSFADALIKNTLFINQIDRISSFKHKELSMKAYLSGLALAAALLLGGCANTQPIKNIDQEAITHTLSQAQVEKAILLAGLKKHWVMKVVSPGLIRGDLALRSHQASIDIRYSERNFSITYVSSSGLDADGQGNIHRGYNRWITMLDEAIRVELLSATQL